MAESGLFCDNSKGGATRTSGSAEFSHFRPSFAAVGTVACVTALSVAPAALGSGATAAAISRSDGFVRGSA
jgi:hypothetical protein